MVPRQREQWEFNPAEYARGSIKEIHVHDFMTYKDVVINPGPRLNLVLGPNGSGKSSVVCSICLGLNGKPKLLGRANDVKEYVRKGSSKGYVEITISGGNEPGARDTVFKREMCAENNSSTWWINGAVKKETDVTAATRALNIQLDNLCQFLPQEKVVEFSKMSPKQLLHSTQRAIGDGELLVMHTKLMEGGQKVHDMEDSKVVADRQLDKLNAQRANMKRDVDKITEQESLVKKSLLFNARAAQLRLRLAKDQEKEAKCELDSTTKEEAQANRRYTQSQVPLQAKQNKLKQLHNEVQTVKVQCTKAQNEIQRLVDDIESGVSNKYEATQDELANCDLLDEKRQQDVRKCNTMLTTLETKISEFPESPPGIDLSKEPALKQQRTELATQLTAIQQQKNHVRHQQLDVEAELNRSGQALDRLRAVEHHRLMALERRYRGIMQFKKRLDELKHNHVFQGNIFGPLALEIKLCDSRDIAAVNALEMHVANRLFSSFVTEQASDQDILNKLARDMQFRVNTINYTSNPNIPLEHRLGHSKQMAHLGVRATLDELFHAPMTVKHVLDDNSGISATYLLQCERDVEAVFNDPGVRVNFVYTPDNCHRQIISKYNASARSTKTDPVRPALLLKGSVDENEVQRLEQLISQLQHELGAKSMELETLVHQEQMLSQEHSRVDADISRIHHARGNHQKELSKLRMNSSKTKTRLADLNRQDPLRKKADFKKQLTSDKAGIHRVVDRMVEVNHLVFDRQRDLTIAMANRGRLEDEIQELNLSGQAERNRLAQLREQLRITRHNHSRACEGVRRRNDTAKNLVKPEMLDELESCPTDPTECEEAADLFKGKAEAITVSDSGTLERYRRLMKDIEAKEAADLVLASELKHLKEDLERARKKWLPQLKEMVDLISDKFSTNFKRIGSVGEVDLFEAGENFGEYAIQIKVKFRESEELAVLSAGRHSGGERAVATIMFLLSLQNITETPLRVVDEINQGMDQTNERVVFQAMVDAATLTGTPQCLLMTPKLLPQLQYSEHVNVLQIYNGVNQIASKYKPELLVKSVLGVHADTR